LELIELKSNIRTSSGSAYVRALRRKGVIPAVIYGPRTEPILLSIAVTEFEQIIKKGRSGQTLINLIIQNGQTLTKPAMIKELQVDPISHNYLHIDFYEIAMDRKIKVNVPVMATGKSKGVELGGILQVIRHELEVLCLPQEIPESIELDVTDLDVGDSIHVKEIPLKGNVEIPADVNFTVVTIISPKVEAVEVEDEEELAEEDVEEGAEKTADSEASAGTEE